MRVTAWTLPAAAALLLAACSGGPADDDAPGTEAVTRDTVDALDTFWTARVPDYTSPTVDLYREADLPLAANACEIPPELYIDNSFYCGADRSIALNLDLLEGLSDSQDSPGPAMLVAAHEWAHHVSLLEGLEARIDVGEELQADCRAGIFVGAVEDGGYTVSVSPEDVDAMLSSLVDLSYLDETGWFDAGAHGDPFARTQALWIGYETGSEDFCDAYIAMEDRVAEADFDDFSVSFLPSMTIVNEATSRDGYPFARAASDYFEDLTVVAYEVPASSQDAVDVFHAVVDEEFTGDGITVLDDVAAREVEEWRGATAVSARYAQVYGGDPYHGMLLVVTEGQGKAALLDVYVPGEAPAVEDESGWRYLEQATDALLRGVDP
ncbi:neutral zinc metallopeptidase [Demequina lignilytica]|uniref:Neutral zinc metallopeptidase n=1 Tax=Demequina lignilytica TaxID=3051663 RepID=A0AAW7M9C8_9MICO|nr:MULTISPECIES: neutral zinc metallopeptidase [unclassified Demequina]MDN4477973.1 neutral zinc metallopeptidase [Demequina sp. SYSU T00039-1]MDN4484248.1 neutral zinc metallopeptidase [Demequina sp. SYSU T0a273]MDN4487882.1 neutral zinc metallopeptidase [Demequina sp. SYSU T00039]MDN4490735.1 neutral zinc metallopeptidase [Demequina sp. SYSU T00068]